MGQSINRLKFQEGKNKCFNWRYCCLCSIKNLKNFILFFGEKKRKIVQPTLENISNKSFSLTFLHRFYSSTFGQNFLHGRKNSCRTSQFDWINFIGNFRTELLWKTLDNMKIWRSEVFVDYRKHKYEKFPRFDDFRSGKTLEKPLKLKRKNFHIFSMFQICEPKMKCG